MRLPYKAYPADPKASPFRETQIWWPVVPMRLVDQRMHVKTKSFHAVVDSGSSACLFHADFLEPFKLNLKDGVEGTIGGVGKEMRVPVYYHNVWILVGLELKIGVMAGFCEELAVAGILGRTGFFDSFRVTFDHSENPPILEINKIEHRKVN